MSKYCGKCDFADWVCDESDEEISRHSFFITTPDDRAHKLDIHNQRDAARYYPYIISMAASSKDNGGVVYLSSSSYIDQREKEHQGWYIRDVMKYWNKCKRDKIKFDKKVAYEKSGFSSTNEVEIKEIINRIAKDGKNATFEGIYHPICEYYRTNWFNCLTEEFGYTKREAFKIVFNKLLVTDEEIDERVSLAKNCF